MHPIAVTTYQTLQSDFSARGKRGRGENQAQCSPLHKVHWHRIVLDESHSVKSEKTGHSQACAALASQHRWCATGTPMGTKIDDYQGQFRFLQMHPLSNATVFKKHITSLFDRSHYGLREGLMPVFRLLKSITVRHTKSQTIGGETVLTLPARTDVDVAVTLSADERVVYDRVERGAREFYEQVPSSQPSALREMDPRSRSLSIAHICNPLCC